MYFPKEHAEFDVPVLQEFVRNFPLGLFTTAIRDTQWSALQTTHLPFVIDTPEDGTPGVLRAHMARANPQAKQLIEKARAQGSPEMEDEVLVLFNAPVHAYVTPKFYIQTKPATGKTVPTWDYAAVQVYGKLRVFTENDDATSAFLARQIDDLTELQEAKTEGKPWKVDDAPESYTNLLKKAIIGLEIKIDRIEGRFKLSQEKPQGDWVGVVQGFRALGTHEGDVMANMVEERGKMRGFEI